MTDNNSRPRPETIAAAHGVASDAAFGAVSPPLYFSTTYEFAGYDQPRAYDYGRAGNPTRDLLADAIARLAPAEETPGIRHANLEAWRKLVGAPGTKVAAFIADLDDPPAGAADVALRALL